MSLKTWAKAPRPKTEEVNEFWAKNGGPPATANSLGDSDGGAIYLDDREQEESFRRYKTPSGRLDGSIWLAWQEMEGDTDGSGEIAMHVGDLDPEPTRLEPLGTFMPEPIEGDVLIKTSRIPVFATGYGQNIGPSLSGHCIWEFEVLRRDMGMNLGLVVPESFDGELDRRWDAKCFTSQAFFWAVTAGVLMNGPSIIKTLPTKKVPHYHYHVGDKVLLDLKVDDRTLSAEVLRVNSEDTPLTNLHVVKLRRLVGEHSKALSTGVEEELPELFLPADRRVYMPEDWDFADGSFFVRMRAAPDIGERFDFEYTGKLTIRLNDVFIGTLKGVPRVSVPGALLSGNGDMVRLRGVWSDRDQKMIDAVRESTLELLGGEHCPGQFKDIITDKALLTDWTILKALRASEYHADVAFNDVRQYVSANCDRLHEKKTARRRQDRAAEGMAAQAEDTTQSDGFLMRDPTRQGPEWNPRSITQALKWKPSDRRKKL